MAGLPGLGASVYGGALITLLCDISAGGPYPQLTLYLDPMKPEDLSLLVRHQMPYGKYQGRLIADLPGNYLAWFARKGFPPGELGRLMALMLELDHNGLSGLLDPLRQRHP